MNTLRVPVAGTTPAAVAANTGDMPTTLATRTEYCLLRAHTFAALATLVISALFGTLVAIKFVRPDFLGSQP